MRAVERVTPPPTPDGVYRLDLECGHHVHREQRQRRARCPFCRMFREKPWPS